MGSISGSLHLERDLPVRYEVDVFVAGGGPAGVAAAVTAARQGASVFLAESQVCLGGMGTAGMLPVFMPFGDSVHFYSGGFGREIYDRLANDRQLVYLRDVLPQLEHNAALKSDPIHLNAEGYRRLAAALHELMQATGAVPDSL